MKTKTNFATTSDVRNLINATMETFPKGPERDGIQTKMFNFWDNFNAGNNLPAGSDRKRFLAEAFDNINAALRTAQRLDNEGNKGCVMKVTVLESKLTGIKVGKNEMAKVEDNFYGKRVVKGIFAKAKFAKEYILWAVPKGKTDTMYSQPIAEHLYTDAQINDVKRRATAAGWHTFRIAEMMSFEDMTNAFKGKPVKRRSSRTGSKAKFAKMSPEKVKMLTEAVQQVVKEKPLITRKYYADHGLSEVRWFWDIYWAAQKKLPPNFVSDHYKDGLHDSHIQTILKSALKSYSSRTGAKAKFANEEIAKGLSKVLKANGFDAMASEVLSGSTDSETLRKYIRALKSKLSPMGGNDRGMFLLQTLEKQLASRTGAKAKFAIKKIKDLGNGWVVEEATGNDAFNPSATELYLTKGSKTIPVESLKHAIETYNDLITGKKGIYK